MATGNDASQVPPQVVQRAFEHRHELVHLLYTATDEADAVRRIGALLDIDAATVGMILDRPLRDLLPENRARLAGPGKPGGVTPSSTARARQSL